MNIYDISRRAGVSIATVSRVLNDSPHVSPETRERVLAVIGGSGYVPNAFARGLGLGSMKTIGLLCPDAADPYLAQALAYLESAFRDHRYDSLLACTGRQPEARAEGVERMISRRVDGLVLMGSSFAEEADEGNESIRRAAGLAPVVLLNGFIHGDNIYCVLCDDRRATMEAAQHLLDTGHGDILYLCHSENYSGRKKLAGYRDALASRGVPAREALIEYFPEGRTDLERVVERLTRLREKGLKFDAVLASEDALAVGAVKFARAEGLRVPEDLGVIGYNNSGFCRFCEPELTSVDNKLRAISDQCVATMLGVLEGREMPRRTVFAGELVRRGSTR